MSLTNSFHFLYYLILITFALSLHASFGVGPLFHFCSTPENFTANSPYESNLKTLFGFLDYRVPPSGFGKGSIGYAPNKASGLGLCRGDVSSTDCKTCVIEAGSEIRNRCPYNKAAIIWYDNCEFKYSNTDFFGQIDNSNKFYMWNVNEVSDPESFNEKIKELLSELAKKAVKKERLFETGEMELEESKKLYGLVQCTRDLSSDVCKKCLDGIIGELPSCCNAKEGGRVISGSCNFRYEIYPFVNV